MQTQNPFLDFAEKMITRYSGFGHAFDPALMVYLEDEGMPGKEEQPLSQNVITNLYNIQNIKEENYLYRQNLSFLTQILEKRLYQNLYPSVQKQIEKVVREEMPQTNDRIVETFSQQMYRLIKQGGINQFEVLKEQISSEIVEKEKMISKEYDVLLRKIENVWNSSFYGNVLNRVDRMETQVIYPTSQITMMFPEIKEVLEKKETFDKNEYLKKKERFDKSEYLEKKENFLEKTIFLIQRQEQMHMLKRLQSVGNLGMAYNHLEVLRDADVHMEYLTESNHAEAFVSEKSGQQKADIYPGGITQENAINQNLNTERIWEKKKLRVRELAEKELIERQLFKRQQDGNNTVTISESTEKYVEKYLTEKLMKSHVEDIRQSRIVNSEKNEENSTQTYIENTDLQMPEGMNLTYKAENQIDHTEHIERAEHTDYIERTKHIEHIDRIKQHTNQVNERSILQNIASDISTTQKWKIINQPVMLQDIIKNAQTTNIARTELNIKRDRIYLEYSMETDEQLHQEIMQLLQKEVGQPPEVPKVAKKDTASGQQMVYDQSSIIQSRKQLVEKSRNLAEQILRRIESINVTQVSRVNSAAKTVVLQELSQAILEYADSNVTTEELYATTSRILTSYQIENSRQTEQEVASIIQNSKLGITSLYVQQMDKNSSQIKYPSYKSISPREIETAPIVYRSEEDISLQQEERTKRLEQQVKEVVKNIKTVEEKTIVHKDEIIEQQKTVVKEVLKSTPTIWKESEGASYIKREVQQSVEEQIDQNVNQIVNKVYRRLEDKLKTERGRRGLI